MKTKLAIKLSILLGLFWAAQLIQAQSLSGTITINGNVPSSQSLSTVDDEFTLNPLGAGYNNQKVGQVVLSSNEEGGFVVTLSSQNGGFIARPGATGSNNRVAYTITLSNRQGNLGNGVTEPSLIALNPNGGQLTFTGQQGSAPTTNLTYDVGVNIAKIDSLVSGDDYTDVLTLTITTL